MSETGTSEIPADEALVRLAYDAYCASVGGKAFNGDPLPHSSVFFNDPGKAQQAKGWRDAIIAVETKLSAPPACRDPRTGALPDGSTPIKPLLPAARLTVAVKTFRQSADALLQAIKPERKELERVTQLNLCTDIEDRPEALAQLVLAQRDLEGCMMRLGMVLKNIGASPNPYPSSKDPSSPRIEPVADGLKM